MADGEYLTRIVVASKYAPRAAAEESAAISTELSIEVKAVTTLLYRKGAVETEIAIAPPRVRQHGDTLDIRLALTPAGTAAFLGTLRFTLESTDGSVVATHDQPVSIYVPVDPLIRMAIPGLAAGDYSLRITPLAVRSDVPPGTLAPLRASPGFRLPLRVTRP